MLASPPIGSPVLIRGWVRTRRDSKAGFSFLEVNDGSCMGNLQVIAETSLPNYADEISKLLPGCSVEIVGKLVESVGGGQKVELRAETVSVLGWADASYPLQKKRHSLEFLRSLAHLRPRTNTLGAVMRVRSSLAQAVHAYFRDNGFFYIHTPIVTSSDAEGAGQMFQVTTLDVGTPPRKPDGTIDYEQDFFGRRTSLTVSGQLEAEIYAMSLGKVYTFGPTFRAENSNTTRHLAEFWMIEPEVAFNDLQANAALAEDFLKKVLGSVLESNADDLKFLDERVQPGLIASLRNVIEEPFERMTYTEAVKHLKASGESFELPVDWGVPLQTEHERYLTEKMLKKPVILTDYPKDIAAFYMRLNDDGKTVRAMDVLVPQIGEIIGGSQREERYEVLKKRLEDLKMSLDDYWWYLELRKYGTAQHSGFGLGFERLVLFATGIGNIRDAIP
ncbi:MAG TPA: asparagine--tRNA ligase, partial [Polyangiaceae bacterium]|nr:asparagine--tRNA ligase [Polyangiaceae bacterium]